MKKHLILLAAFVLPMLLCNAQKSDNEASALTAEQASKVAKILRQHNAMIEYCGCCETPAAKYIQISKVSHDSVSVTVTGTNIETGERYKKVVDVAEVWTPQLTSGSISKMQCVGLLAKINCDPCTNPSVPTGGIGKKMLELELDGLMEASGEKPAKEVKYDLKNQNRDLDAAKKISKRKVDNINKSLSKEPKPLKREAIPIKKLPKNTEE